MRTPTEMEFLAGVEPGARPTVEALMAAVQSLQPPLTTAIQWRQFTFSHDGDAHHWICSIAVTRHAVSLRFHFGSLMRDPEQIFRAGTSRFLRSIDFNKPDDVDTGLIRQYVKEALSHLDDFKAEWRSAQCDETD